MTSWVSSLILLSIFFSLACVPKFVPKDLAELTSPAALGQASQRAFEKARESKEKKEIVRWAYAGMLYSNKCLGIDPDQASCLYFNVVNQGLYIKHNFINYQAALKKMVRHCKHMNTLDPTFQHAGCYRVLGELYAKAPPFSLNPANVTRDLDRSRDYLREAVRIAPDYPLNHFFLARTLQEMGENEAAKNQLEQFDHLAPGNLDKVYPEWKKDREALAQKLQNE